MEILAPISHGYRGTTVISRYQLPYLYEECIRKDPIQLKHSIILRFLFIYNSAALSNMLLVVDVSHIIISSLWGLFSLITEMAFPAEPICNIYGY